METQLKEGLEGEDERKMSWLRWLRISGLCLLRRGWIQEQQ